MSSKNILSMLKNLAQASQFSKGAAIDESTEHASGSADDGDQSATTGSFASTNEADAKENQGPAGVDTAGEGTNPKEKQPNLPQQEELNPGDATDPAPAEIKPTDTVESAGTDDDTKPVGSEPEESGKAAAAQQKCASFLSAVSAVLPVEDGGPASKSAAASAPANKGGAAGTPDTVKAAAEKKAADSEAAAAQIIRGVLALHKIPDDADVQTKKACLIEHYSRAGARAASGFLLSLDENMLKQAMSGQFQAPTRPRVKKAEGETMPESVPESSGAPAAPAEAPAEAAPPADAGAAAGGPDAAMEQQIMQILQMVESGEITVEQMLVMLQEIGVPPEVIEMIAQQLGAAGDAPPAEGGGEMAPSEPAPPAPAEDVAAATESSKAASDDYNTLLRRLVAETLAAGVRDQA